MPLRILFLADTHLGFDLPLTPRVVRRRRGDDFLASYHRALEPALEGAVDLVVHGGDLFHRARPHHTLVAQAFARLTAVADRGVPVVLVPGNHERSRIPHARFAAHPAIRIFDGPRTFLLDVAGVRVALAGFPYERTVVRAAFPRLLAATGWRAGQADISLLCLHHCVEGATVGPQNHVFRRGPDVIRCQDLPEGFAAVLSGHIHRHQVLRRDLIGRPLPAPVLYPGSTERTAFAEMGEDKGTLRVDVDDGGVRWRFQPLPTRPMLELEIRAGAGTRAELERRVEEALAKAPDDAVLRLKIVGPLAPGAWSALSAGALRALAPEMNVEVMAPDAPSFRPGGRRRTRVRTRRSRHPDPNPLQHSLPIPPTPRS